jgi:chitodextrinase
MHQLTIVNPWNLIMKFSKLGLLAITLTVLATMFFIRPAHAACTSLPTTYGSATQTISVPSDGTYRIWSRILAPDTTNNSYYLEVDGTTCGVNVGDSAITANTWTWVDYKDGNNTTKIDIPLTTGSHTISMIGKEPNVELDRIIVTTDTTCTPTGTGDNCVTSSADAIPPTVSVTAPTSGATTSGSSVVLSANAADNVGVAGVQFKVDGNDNGTEDTSSPYSVTWDSTKVANGSHTITAVARDAAGNSTTSSSVSVTVSNSTTPTNLTIGETNILNSDDNGNANLLLAQGATLSQTATLQSMSFYVATAAGNLRLGIYDATGPGGGPGAKKAETAQITPVVGWNTANVTVPVSLPAGTYWLTYLPSDNNLHFRVDGSGSAKYYTYTYGTMPAVFSTAPVSTTSHWSLYASLNTGGSTADTTPPTTPAGLAATAAAYNKVNLSWSSSTDNVGVTGYNIVRNGTTIAQTIGTTYSDVTVAPSTSYTYQVIAFDAAGNNSGLSNSAAVTTPAAPDTTPPSAPTSLSATAASSTQINLAWAASSDNIGVTSYDIYRNNVKISSTATTSFGDTGLSPSTTYSYNVIARDAAGNSSPSSAIISATTQAVPVSVGNLVGNVKGKGGRPLASATVSLVINGTRSTATTNSAGNYSFSNIPAGNYSVTFSATGYASKTQSTVINANQTTTLNVTLK